MFGLETGLFILLAFALLAACFFEFINGFHDTANAVATVIYTNSLKPITAVILSGSLNFLGVMIGGIGVGVSIINLLPVELLIEQNTIQSMIMIFSILISAIIWNLGTWYYGIPSSSSHTLIGAIIGVGLGYALLPETEMGISAVNWSKVKSVFTGLLIAPIIGFGLALILMWILKKVTSKEVRKQIFDEPNPGEPPPRWIRGVLISTCGLVSFAHGNNDGQKGIGLVMLILIAAMPAYFSINEKLDIAEFHPQIVEAKALVNKINIEDKSSKNAERLKEVQLAVSSLEKTNKLTETNKLEVRKNIILASRDIKIILSEKPEVLNKTDRERLSSLLTKDEKGIRKLIDYAPNWIKLMISLSLGFGTMIGWKRIVITVGEKIGKSHLTYAQGASAELVAASTVGLASGFGLPVSTTHTLSSGIAGSMVASKGLGNLQVGTIKSILITWVLTLPATIIFSSLLYFLLHYMLS